jgi:hypothetical protein
MSSRLHRRAFTGGARTLLLAIALLGTHAFGTPQRVESFETGTWSQLLAGLPRPAVVVFSTTYCAVCPETFSKLAETIEARRLKASLIIVVMDGEGHAELLRDPHYQHADQLFVFRGQEAALRHAVNARWRGATPFVALLPKDRAPVFVTGMPASRDLNAWAAAK